MSNKYQGNLDKFISKDIYLNVNHLEEGRYNLKIIHEDKVINTTQFKK